MTDSRRLSDDEPWWVADGEGPVAERYRSLAM
jgi:hypothetical protein